MKYYKILSIFIFLTLLFLVVSCEEGSYVIEESEEEKPLEEEDPIIGNELISHPRILLLKGEEAQIKQLISTDATWEKMHKTIIEECNTILTKPVLERELIGKRLLATSRELFKRVFYLSYGYRMSEDIRYLEKAEKEMLSVALFSDWNPSHFLDVAELTMGIAIGYDWLHSELSDSSKKVIREAIVNKGLIPSKEGNNWWLQANTNWNQVCNAGMTFGALAVQEHYPELAKEIIDRAFNSIKLAMKVYSPDGVYPEGYGYWHYGTTFNLLFLSAVEKVFGDDKGLSSTPGFLKTAYFLKHMITPSQISFNWGDSQPSANLSVAMFWFAEKLQDPSLLWSEKKFLEQNNFSRYKQIRELPAIMIWAKNTPLSNITTPEKNYYFGQGENPMSAMRSSWLDSDAIFLGFKGGAPNVPHGHMDVGSFVMESDGVRWAGDPGTQDYNSLESIGMDIWKYHQAADRWKVLILNNRSHNVLTINDKQQNVSGYAKLDRYSGDKDFMYSISDLTRIYEEDAVAVKRGVAIKNNKYIIIRDEIQTSSKEAKVRWAMFTTANVVLGDNFATLSSNGKKLFLKVNGVTNNITMKKWNWSDLKNEFDKEYKGATMVGFETTLAPHQTESLEVLLVPQDSNDTAEFINMKLEEW